MDIEKNYCKARAQIPKENIDFWGINLTDGKDKELVFKVYRSEKTNRNTHHPLIRLLQEREMLRHYEDVLDSSKPERRRLDAALYQRNDANMEALFHYLRQTIDYFEPHYVNVKEISKMKITDREDYNYASLYHVGLLENKGEADLLKFYFFTRWCEDPNHHKNQGYRDKEYLKYFKTLGIPEYRDLAGKAEYLLEKSKGHLWMGGMDISKEKVKYKIYLKNIQNAYEFLPHICGEEARKKLEEICVWNKAHNECKMAGIAMALDSEGESSMNIYYYVD